MIKILSKTSSKLYIAVFRPILFKFSADSVHGFISSMGKLSQKVPLMMTLVRKIWSYQNERLSQTLHGIDFINPIGLSAGFDKEAKLPKLMKNIGFGLEEVGSITAMPYSGNKKPWYTRLPHTKSVLVYSGLRSSGVDKIALKADRISPKLYENFPINASVARTNSASISSIPDSISDYCTSLERLERSQWPSMYTINISCPNTENGEPFNNPNNLRLLLKAIEDLNLSRPVFLKMPIDLGWTKTKKLITIASKSSVSGLTIGNLSKDRSLVHDRDKAAVKGRGGNLSGKPCWSASNELLARIYAEFGDRFTLIGVGGVFSAKQAYTKIKLGASLVELITGMIYQGPSLIGSINHQLTVFLEKDGLDNISQAVGLDNNKYLKELLSKKITKKSSN